MSRDIDWIGGLKIAGTVLGVGIVVYAGYAGVKWLQKKWPDIKSWWTGVWDKVKDPFGINQTLSDATGGDLTLLPTGDENGGTGNSLVGNLLTATPAGSAVTGLQLLTGGGVPDEIQLSPGVSLLSGLGAKPRPPRPKPNSSSKPGSGLATGVQNVVAGLTGLLGGKGSKGKRK